jgi:hypothetical protein
MMDGFLNSRTCTIKIVHTGGWNQALVQHNCVALMVEIVPIRAQL